MAENELTCDCAVLGGGAAGMMAAITAAGKHAQVVVIEHTKRIGSKLLQTGNGKCNFTNLNMTMDMYQNDNTEFVRTVIEQFDVPSVLAFFKKIGVYSRERNGYIYPHSETAASLQDALRLELERLHVRVVAACEIDTIECAVQGHEENDGFCLYGGGWTIKARTLIMATGSKAAPKTGSDGSGYELAKRLGHHIRKPLPALVQLVSPDKLCRAMAGVRSTGLAALFIDGNMAAQDLGEIQYTDYGISGIPVFQISRYAVQAVDLHKKVWVTVDMLPDFALESLLEELAERMHYEGQKTLEQFFAGILNKKLVYAAAKQCGMESGGLVSAAGFHGIKKILKQMKCFRLDITGFKSFENAQVCQGGVRLDEIDAATMQSKLHKGLYFAGELADVDGRCGGYNLQWAWSSGYVAGRSAADFVRAK